MGGYELRHLGNTADIKSRVTVTAYGNDNSRMSWSDRTKMAYIEHE